MHSPSVDNGRQRAAQLRALAKKALVKHRYQDAVDLLSEAIYFTSKDHKLYRLRSTAFACLENYEDAILDAEKLIELMPESPDGFFCKAHALYRDKQYLEAARAYEQALKFSPTDKVLLQGFWDSLTLLSQTRAQSKNQSTDDPDL